MQTHASRKRKRLTPTTHDCPPPSSYVIGARKRATPHAVCSGLYDVSAVAADVDGYPDADLERLWNVCPDVLDVSFDGPDQDPPTLNILDPLDPLDSFEYESRDDVASLSSVDASSMSTCTFVSSASTQAETKDETKDETEEEVRDEARDEARDETKDEARDETKDGTKDVAQARPPTDMPSTRLVICIQVAPIGKEEYSAMALSLCHISHRRRIRDSMAYAFARALKRDAVLADSLLSPRLDACVPHILCHISPIGLRGAVSAAAVQHNTLRIDAVPGTCLVCLRKGDVFRMHGLCDKCWASQRSSLTIRRWHQHVMSGLCVNWARVWHDHSDSATFLTYVWQWVCGVVNVDFCVCLQSNA